MMRKIVLALCVIGVATAQESFKDCLEQDSISCLQMTVRTQDYFFDITEQFWHNKRTLNQRKKWKLKKKEKKREKWPKSCIGWTFACKKHKWERPVNFESEHEVVRWRKKSDHELFHENEDIAQNSHRSIRFFAIYNNFFSPVWRVVSLSQNESSNLAPTACWSCDLKPSLSQCKL